MSKNTTKVNFQRLIYREEAEESQSPNSIFSKKSKNIEFSKIEKLKGVVENSRIWLKNSQATQLDSKTLLKKPEKITQMLDDWTTTFILLK